MRILYITNKPIYPKIDGGCVAMDAFLQNLLEINAEVKHLTIATDKHPFDPQKTPEGIRDAVQTEAVYVDTRIKPVSAFFHLFQKNRSYNIHRFDASKMHELIKNTLAEQKFDHVVLDSLYVMPYFSTIKALFSGTVFLRAHNVEHEIWRDLASSCRNPLKRWYLKKLQRDLETYERSAIRQVDGIFALSEDDRHTFIKYGATNTVLIPVAVPVSTSYVNNYAGNHLYHLGSTKWKPNFEAIQRLFQLFPEIQKKSPQIELHIGGDPSALTASDYSIPGIFIDGFIENPTEYALQHGILVTPILSGSGIRIKILEAMALGIPVVTTTIGAKGIDTKQEVVLIADEETEFVALCTRLVTDKSFREQIGSNAKAYIRQNHSFETISRQLREFFEKK